MARDPVQQWAGDAATASQAVGGVVPTSVLLGLVKIESGGIEGRTSSAGAGGLTQFMPDTANSYGVDVRPGHALSQLTGAAKYLVALGFERDPEHALAAYNGGPGNADLPVTHTYARNVLAAAKAYTGFDTGHVPASSPATGDGSAASTRDGTLVNAAQHTTLVQFGVTAGLVLAALAAIVVGAARAAGVRSPLAGATA